MYLKSIEMQGFKSFPDRTKLIFDAGAAATGKETITTESGVTVIVGPNGSGKSNIADAMRWVLGEISSKSLRGTKMEDVIFGGADSRRPMGFAEVSVTFDNTSDFAKLDCPYDEVTVTRRYFRAADSEYYINRKAVRLKDIYELFMNTGIGRDGYSIIGQGRIAEIVSRKSEERRAVFEEASGIAKYRHKKTETERKLASVDANMERVLDVFGEVESQLLPLEKEAAKATKAIELLDMKKRADVMLWLFDTERLRGEVDAAQTALKHSEFDLQTAEDALQALDVQSKKLYESSQENRAQSGELTEKIKISTQESFRLDGEFRVLENNIAHTDGLIEETKTGMRNTEEYRKAALEKCSELKARIAALEELIKSQKSEYDKIGGEVDSQLEVCQKLQDEVATALGDIKAAEQEATDIKVRISALESARDSGSDRTGGIIEDIENYEEEVRTLDKNRKARKSAVDKYQSEINTIKEEREKIGDQLEEANEKYGQLSEDTNNERLRRDSIAQRIKTYKDMEEHFEGYAQAVRFIMNKYAEGSIKTRDGAPCGKIYGPLSKLISVDDKYVTAVETALGANLQYIVVEDEETAKSAIYCLHSAGAGRTTFFPLTSMRAQTVTDEMRTASGYTGYIATADSIVACDGKFREVLSSLLGRTLIFDNIDNATKMAKQLRYRVRVVTLDGQQINPGGSFTGGSTKQNGSILGRAGEIRRLEEELSTRSASVEKLEKQLKDLKEEITDLSDKVADCDERSGIISMLMSAENTQLEQLTAKIDASTSLIAKLKEDYDQVIKMSEQYESDIAGLNEEAAAIDEKIKAMTAVRIEKDEKCAYIEENIRALEDKRTELLITVNGTEKDVETTKTLYSSADERVKMYDQERVASQERIEHLKETVANYIAAQEENRHASEICRAELDKLNAQYADAEQSTNKFEEQIANLNEKIRMKMSEKEVLFKEFTINENKLNNLKSEADSLAGSLWEDYALTRADAIGLGYPPLKPEERAETVQLQTDCRNKLRHIGNVDLDAANKYKEVKERYDDMKVQIDDMEKAKAELTGIISQVDTEMRTAFQTSFEEINRNFATTFSELFGGGSAELSLTDPENILESGIEIKAAPPGKIIKNLMQLSGGEQTFVAIALFFAILQVNPTPFCILDEIEAALDEVNVERLAQYIRRYSDGTQFILITHRRGTMAAANRLYGVTMPEHGISKVLQLDINDISKKKEGDWDGIFG